MKPVGIGVDHVQPTDDGSGLLRPPRSKTNQAGEGAYRRRAAVMVGDCVFRIARSSCACDHIRGLALLSGFLVLCFG